MRAALRAVPSRSPGRAGGVGGHPVPSPLAGLLRSQRRFAALVFAAFRGARKLRLARRRTGIQPKPIHRNDPGTPAARPLPGALRTREPPLPSPGAPRLRAVPGARSMGSGRAPAAATAVPGGRLGTLRAGALPGAAPPARWARASPPLFNAAAAVVRSSPSPKTRGRCFTFTFRESRPAPSAPPRPLSRCPSPVVTSGCGAPLAAVR